MNILIAGGSGLIGRSLTRTLIQSGHTVSILTRAIRPDSPGGTGARQLVWDGKTANAPWANEIERTDAVINLAGENIGDSPWTAERKLRIRASRVDAGFALAEAITAAQHKPAVLLQSSAIGYYGISGDQPLTENSPFGKDYLTSVSVDWEASTQAVEPLGVRRAILRTGIYLSPEGGAFSRFLTPWKMGLGGPMGSGKQWLSWIHPRDEIAAIQFLLEHDSAAGPFNLTAPNPVTNAEFGRTLAKVMGKPFWAPIPGFALKALLGEMSTLVLDGQRVLPEKLLELGYAFAFPQLEPALMDLIK